MKIAFWIWLTALYIFLVVVLIYAFEFDWRTAVDLLILSVGLIPLIVKNSPDLYLRWSRFWFWLVNFGTTWNLSYTMTGAFKIDEMQRFINSLIRENPENNQLLEQSDVRFIFRYHRIFTIELLLSQEYFKSNSTNILGVNTFPACTLTVHDQEIAYRRSRKIIEDILIPLLEKVHNTFHPASSKYSMRIDFADKNPFFGLYVQQLRLETVREFSFTFTLPTPDASDYITVTKNDMTVFSTTLSGLRKLAISSLTLKVREA